MTPGRLVRAYAWILVALRHVVVLAWIAAAAAATLYLPGLGGAASSPLGDLVPKHAEATEVAERSTELFGNPLVTDTMVVQRDPAGLSPAEQRRTLLASREASERPERDLALISGALPISNAFGLLSERGERSTTAVTYLFFSAKAGLQERDQDAHKYARRYLGRPEAHVVGVTGAAPARIAQFEEIDDSLPLIEIASVLLIALIVGVHFRSLAAPLVTVFAAAIAYLVAIRALAWGAARVDLRVAQEVEPLVLVLLLGLVTDYSVFLMSAMRRALADGKRPAAAAREGAARTVPVILAAGVIVAGGVAALALGRLEFFQTFGPSLAITSLVALAVSVTFVPAAMALFGPRLFGGNVGASAGDARREPPSTGPLTGRFTATRRVPRLADDAGTSPRSMFVARVLSARPLAALAVIFAVLLLVLPATGLSRLDLGLTFIRSLPHDSEPRRAAVAAAEGFAPGIVSPTEVLLERRGVGERREELGRLERLLAGQPGVAAVVGPREEAPVARFRLVTWTTSSAARFAVVLDDDPLGSTAIDRLHSLQERMPRLLAEAGLDAGTPARYGGETALADQTIDLMAGDLARIAVVALAVNFLLLALFMRALVAPLFLLGASVLGLAATLGLTVYFAEYALGTDELTYYVPFAAAVLLVSLGSDYNIFVAGRIWAEARRRRLREAIAVATPAAARTIRAAGIALAASFALLAIVPLQSFREFAFVMAAGIAIDTFVVRPLLIPSLISLFGEVSWRPGRRIRTVPLDEFAERVARRSSLSPAEAVQGSDVVLETLAERITRKERRVLALHLPKRLRPALKAGGLRAEDFTLDEFLRRVGERQGASADSARENTRAVMTTLAEVVAKGEMEYLRAQLSPDYEAVLRDGDEEARGPSPPRPYMQSAGSPRS
jgi:putative drug exporter of the RND superfamily